MERTLESNLTLEDLEQLSPDYRQIAEAVGINGFIRLTKAFGGEQLYIPTFRTITRSARDESIISEYNGFNSRQLATKYGISRRYVYALVAQSKQ